MNMPPRNGYTALLVLVAAAPLVAASLGLVGCSKGSSAADGDLGDSGIDSPSDAAVDSPRDDAAADADIDSSVLQDAAPPAVECDGGTCVVDISRGSDDTCILTSTGLVYCWGDNACGEVGAPLGASDAGDAGADFNPVSAPRQILSGVKAISAGASSTCAILASGEVRCWGSLASLFGDTSSGGYNHACTPNATPTPIAGVPHLSAVSSTLSNGCGVTEDKDLWCWGSSFDNLLGRAGYSSCSYFAPCEKASYPPARADLVGGKVRDVIVSYGGVLVLDESNRLWSWGGNEALGRTSSLAIDPTPGLVDLPNLSSASASLFGDGQYTANNSCAASQGKIYCWGDYHTPPRVVPLPAGQYAAQVSASFHACTRTVDGSVFCWGSNQAGQLGDGTGADHPLVPTKVEGLKAKAVKVVASKATTCALLLTGEVQCWGANDKGQLGIGSADFLPHLQPGSAVAFQ